MCSDKHVAWIRTYFWSDWKGSNGRSESSFRFTFRFDIHLLNYIGAILFHNLFLFFIQLECSILEKPLSLSLSRREKLFSVRNFSIRVLRRPRSSKSERTFRPAFNECNILLEINEYVQRYFRWRFSVCYAWKRIISLNFLKIGTNFPSSRYYSNLLITISYHSSV